MPLCPKKSRECLHLLKHGYKIPVNPALLFVPVFQNSLHRRVRHASVHPDHAFHDLMIYDLPFSLIFHQTTQSQTVLPLVENRSHWRAYAEDIGITRSAR